MDSRNIDQALTKEMERLPTQCQRSPAPKKISLGEALSTLHPERFSGAARDDDAAAVVALTISAFVNKRTISQSNLWEKSLTDTPVKHSNLLAANYNSLLEQQLKREFLTRLV